MKSTINFTSALFCLLLFPLTGQAQKMLSKDSESSMKGPLLETKSNGSMLNKIEITSVAQEAVETITPVNPFKASTKPYVTGHQWIATKGTPLHTVLQDWSDKAGWSLVWNSEYNYTLQANATFRGDYISAIKQLFDALGDMNPPIYPELYQGNFVLQIGNKPSR
ncbi:TPA: toxin co-regulated pilus biosynthesis Q family protein [Enterobacter asburiae]